MSTFTSTSFLKKTSPLSTFFKGLTLFFLWLSAAVLVTYGLDIHPWFSWSAVQYLQKIVLTSNGTVLWTTGVVVDGSGKISSSTYCDLGGTCIPASQMIGGASGEPLFLANSGLFAKQALTWNRNIFSSRVANNSWFASRYLTWMAWSSSYLSLYINGAASLSTGITWLPPTDWTKGGNYLSVSGSLPVTIGDSSNHSEALSVSGNIAFVWSNRFLGTKNFASFSAYTSGLSRIVFADNWSVFFWESVIAGTPFIFWSSSSHFSTFSNPDYSWGGDHTVWMFHPWSDQMGFVVSGIQKIIVSTWWVGIGGIVPQYPLEVSGSIYVNSSALSLTATGIASIGFDASHWWSNLMLAASNNSNSRWAWWIFLFQAWNWSGSFPGGNVSIQGWSGHTWWNVSINGWLTSAWNIFLASDGGNVAVWNPSLLDQRLVVSGSMRATHWLIVNGGVSIPDGSPSREKTSCVQEGETLYVERHDHNWGVYWDLYVCSSIWWPGLFYRSILQCSTRLWGGNC